ncbi:MAG: cytidine deaminase [bacterium]|nr:cytidine deaminase [bacterium]
MNPESLMQAARDVAKCAYAPYSHFTVGAAVLTRQGHVYCACNVENVSYGLTSCAERNAIFKAISEGEREFVAIALAAPTCVTPCGACRQVLQEFATGELKVYMTTLEEAQFVTTTLAQLLPNAFHFEDNPLPKTL